MCSDEEDCLSDEGVSESGYYRGIIQDHLRKDISPSSNLADAIISTAFNPVFTAETNREEISLCNADKIDPHGAAKKLEEHSRKKHKCAMVALLLPEDFATLDFDFTIEHDGHPFCEHATAYLPEGFRLSDGERRAIRNALKAKALERDIYFLG